MSYLRICSISPRLVCQGGVTEQEQMIMLTCICFSSTLEMLLAWAEPVLRTWGLNGMSWANFVGPPKWTHWDLNPGPSACEADVIPLHHVPICQAASCHRGADVPQEFSFHAAEHGHPGNHSHTGGANAGPSLSCLFPSVLLTVALPHCRPNAGTDNCKGTRQEDRAPMV